jgi:hypothetical protein
MIGKGAHGCISKVENKTLVQVVAILFEKVAIVPNQVQQNSCLVLRMFELLCRDPRNWREICSTGFATRNISVLPNVRLFNCKKI